MYELTLYDVSITTSNDQHAWDEAGELNFTTQHAATAEAERLANEAGASYWRVTSRKTGRILDQGATGGQA